MSLRPAIVVIAAIITCSCSSHSKTAKLKVPQSTNGTMPAVMARQIMNAVDAGEGDLQVKRMRAKIAAEPNNVDPRLELASYYESHGAPELALEHSRLAHERFPASEAALLALVRRLRLNHQPYEALVALSSAPKGSVKSWAWYGILCDDAGDLKSGEKAHRKALELEPNDDTLHNNLGYNLLLQGKKKDAAAEFRKALELNSSSEVARNNLGKALVGEPSQALAVWQSASGPAVAHNNLAVEYLEQGNIEAARKELETAMGFKQYLPELMHNVKLVAELDGQPITIQSRQAKVSFWKRIGRGMKGALTESEPASARNNAPAAH